MILNTSFFVEARRRRRKRTLITQGTEVWFRGVTKRPSYECLKKKDKKVMKKKEKGRKTYKSQS
jgi:hypothetical protein